MLKKLILSTLLISTLAAAQEIPSHHQWIADEANLLSDNEEGKLRQGLNQENMQICILTLVNIIDSPKEIAIKALNLWNPGPKSIILLISMNPRKVYLQPGTDLSTIFSEKVSSNLCQNVVAPHLKQGHMFDGCQAAIQAIRMRLLQPENPINTDSSNLPLYAILGISFLIPITIVGVIIKQKYFNDDLYSSASDISKSSYSMPYIPRTSHSPVSSATTYSPAPSNKKSKPKSSSDSHSSGRSLDNYSSSRDYSNFDYGSYDSGSSFSCDGGGGGGADF